MTEKGLECLDCNSNIYGKNYLKKNKHLKMSIDDKGVKIKVNDGKDKAEIKINKQGVTIN